MRGDLAAVLTATGSSVSDAFRYDAYGLTSAQVTSGLPTPWRFQGRLLESTPGTKDLYDFGARSYTPDLGVFTSFDVVAGGAQNPITLNRYLYANADPETLIDPDGREGFDPFAAFGSFVGGVGDVGANAVAFGQGVTEGAIDFGIGTVTGTVIGTVALAGATVAAGSCALNGACRDRAIGEATKAAASVAADPLGSAGRAVSGVANAAVSTAASAVADVGTAWSTGNFRRLGHLTFDAAATAVTVVSVAGAVRAIPAAARNLGGLGRLEGKLQTVADRAATAIPGKGPVRGTHVHSEFRREVDSLGRRDVSTERSYLGAGKCLAEPRGRCASMSASGVQTGSRRSMTSRPEVRGCHKRNGRGSLLMFLADRKSRSFARYDWSPNGATCQESHPAQTERL